jgi:hypothetical protein
MEFAVRPLGGWAVPYVVPVASAPPVFDADGRIREGPSRSSSIPADCGARQDSISDGPSGSIQLSRMTFVRLVTCPQHILVSAEKARHLLGWSDRDPSEALRADVR